MYSSECIVDCRVAMYSNYLVMQGEALPGESMKVIVVLHKEEQGECAKYGK